MLLVIEDMVDNVPDSGHRPLTGLRASQVMAIIQVEAGIPLKLHHDPLFLLQKEPGKGEKVFTTESSKVQVKLVQNYLGEVFSPIKKERHLPNRKRGPLPLFEQHVTRANSRERDEERDGDSETSNLGSIGGVFLPYFSLALVGSTSR